KRVYSHPQALAQCRSWLAGNLPEASLEETSSTAAAALRASQEPDSAAIGGVTLAQRHDLNILARNIQDRAINLTRFLVIGRGECPPTGRDKTSILFATAHKPGSLHAALTPLAQAGINLNRIESRPIQDKLWEYVFFVDFEGHQADENVRAALAGLAAEVEKCKVLGSYPAADLLDGEMVNHQALWTGPAEAGEFRAAL
ncbi:MAG: prephenate dehydratase domain-containing protein, partial [Pseudomonadota bacterium]